MATTMKLRNGKMLVKKDNYYERLRYFSDMYNDVGDVFSANYNLKKKIEVIYNIYSLLYDAFENIHHEFVRGGNKREDSFLNLITVLERRGNMIIQDIVLKNVDEEIPNLEHLQNIVENTIKKIQKHKKLHKNEKNSLLCRLSCKIGSDLTLHVNSFL
jgi:hypothetical protein